VFDEVLAELDRAGLRPPLVHAANSAATLLGLPRPDGTTAGLGYDLVRFGIALYGLRPGPDVPMAGLRPALSWRTVLTQVKTVPAGRGISYGHTHVTDHAQRIGTLAVGYADGFRRGSAHEVLVGGVRVSVLGRVCMDQCMVDLDAVPGAAAGDEVVLIGEQGGQRITADDVAARWGTIGYEVVCGIGHRVPRRHRERPVAS
jgi:alanine racemase